MGPVHLVCVALGLSLPAGEFIRGGGYVGGPGPEAAVLPKSARAPRPRPRGHIPCPPHTLPRPLHTPHARGASPAPSGPWAWWPRTVAVTAGLPEGQSGRGAPHLRSRSPPPPPPPPRLLPRCRCFGQGWRRWSWRRPAGQRLGPGTLSALRLVSHSQARVLLATVVKGSVRGPPEASPPHPCPGLGGRLCCRG